MRILLGTLFTFAMVFLSVFGFAKEPGPEFLKPPTKEELRRQISLRSDCAQATAQTDMSINNVRARLMTGGDVWWDLQDGKYIVPKVDPGSGILEVSSIFAGAVWLGGYDPVGNLKVAAQTYRRQTRNDFWPGPLDNDGQTQRDECAKWDKFFKVLGTNITTHLRAFNEALENETPYEFEDVPLDVLGWPGFGNPYFRDVHNFELPDTDQGLAGFHDFNGDGIYNPIDGDYPIIEIRGCDDPQYPDEMVFWIYNDNGGVHTSSNGFPIQMEVQVQAFAYATNDEINDMTFQRYKLINRATQDITETFFAMWVDPDLGCYQDDYIGCDTIRSMMVVYNEDAVDGIVGCDCAGVPTYCTNVPILGVDYFRGPLDPDDLINVFDPITGDSILTPRELGMSSFVYHNNPSVGTPPPATTDPATAIEFYRYLSGFWREGTPVTFGGDGYNVGSTDVIKYTFPSNPASTSANAWSMCSESLEFGDRRTIQASGPFRLEPGAVNELIIGVVWLPSQKYPCPDFGPLQFVDDIAQDLFDNCFELTDGPDAPDVCIVELDQELVFLLTNDVSSNNYLEAYEGVVIPKPADIEDTLYRFEGYKVFQLSGPDVGPSELTDPDKARIIFQADLKNGVSTIYNWNPIEDPTGSMSGLLIPELMVEGADAGISHSFTVTEDQFGLDDRNLVNHKKYYFMAIAYAYNLFEEFNPSDPIDSEAQLKPYLEGRNNVRQYIAIPRPITSTYLNAQYGDGVEVARLDGQGNPGVFLELKDEMYDHILSGEFDGILRYKTGAGPIIAKVVNPLEVIDAELELTFYNEDGSNVVKENTKWVVTDMNSNKEIYSDISIERLNEQIIQDYGISITMLQPDTLGQRGGDPSAASNNGAIGARISFESMDEPMWFAGIPDLKAPLFGGLPNLRPFNYIKNQADDPDVDLDPTQALNRIGDGFFAPLFIMDYRIPDNLENFYFSPMLITGNGPQLRTQLQPINVNNVDIVFTPDKSKWSRCMVVQTASTFYSSMGQRPLDNTNMLDYRDFPSIGLDGRYATSDGTRTGVPLTEGSENPNDPNYVHPKGMGWFPGYAIDAVTGERLNIFFGENSVYDDRYAESLTGGGIGDDMIWNPSDEVFNEDLFEQFGLSPMPFVAGGQHYIYITRQSYDQCRQLYPRFIPRRSVTFKAPAFSQLTWAGFPILNPGMSLLSYEEGLIPNEVTLKLRVNQRYRETEPDGLNQGMPKYLLSIRGLQSSELDNPGIENQLDMVNVVPNPYYGYSAYEISQFTNTVKITNLPDKCTVTIYTLDGKFIKQFRRDENPMATTGSNPGSRFKQVVPALEWDLRNSKNIPIASGVYLIHIDAGPLGERVLKWFGVSRQFDPSGL